MKMCLLGPCRFAELEKYFQPNDQELANKHQFKGTGGTPVNELIKFILEHKKNTEITLITFDKIKHDFVLNSERLKIYVLKKSKGMHYTFFLREHLKIIKVLRKIDFDFIHSHWPLYSIIPTIKYNKNTLVTLHDHPKNCLKLLGLSHFPYFLLSFFLYKFAKHLSFISNHSKEYFHSIFPNKKAHLIRNIYNIQKKSDLKSVNKKIGKQIKLVCVGNDSKLKNISCLIKALNLLQNKIRNDVQISLDLYGPGLDYHSNSFKKFDSMTWSSQINVSFNGNIDFSKLIKEISSSSILIHPSLEEAFPGPIIEALLLKIPIIAGKNVGDTNIILKDGEYGKLVSVNDPSAVCDGLINVIQNYDKFIEAFDTKNYSNHINILLNNKAALGGYFNLYENIMQ